MQQYTNWDLFQVRESKGLLEAGKPQVPGNKVSLISKKHDILLVNSLTFAHTQA